MGKHYRRAAAAVIQIYLELEEGTVGDTFDPRLLNFRMDVDRILKRIFSVNERAALLCVHRRGLTAGEAVALACIVTRKKPAAYIAALESRLGRSLQEYGLLDFQAYL
jgi:hypothetical protein